MKNTSEKKKLYFEDAKKYRNSKEFRKSAPSAYLWLSRNGYLKEATSHFDDKIKKNIFKLKYKKHLEKRMRFNGKNEIWFIRHENLLDFIRDVLADKGIPNQFKLYLGLSLTGCLRISEAMSLRKKDFYTSNDCWYYKSIVLKKKKNSKKEIREGSSFIDKKDYFYYDDIQKRENYIPSPLVEILLPILKDKEDSDRLFQCSKEDLLSHPQRYCKTFAGTFYENKIRRSLLSYIGELSLHSLRHSAINYIVKSRVAKVNDKDLALIELAQTLNISIQALRYYLNVDAREVLRDSWGLEIA